MDIIEFSLPSLDQSLSPSMSQYAQPHKKAWAAKVNFFDGYNFVTLEYNHGTSGALKNAIDFLYCEWNNKAAGLSATAMPVEGARWRIFG